MEKTRDLFKKIRDTKGTFRAKMGSICGKQPKFVIVLHTITFVIIGAKVDTVKKANDLTALL